MVLIRVPTKLRRGQRAEGERERDMILFGDWYGEAGAKESGAHAVQLLQTKPHLHRSITSEWKNLERRTLLSHVSSPSPSRFPSLAPSLAEKEERLG